LITAIIIGFSIFNRPSQEQIAAQQRMRDSLEPVEKQPAVTDLPTDTSEKEVSDSMQGSSVADFFGAAAISTSSAADSSLVAVATSTDSLLADSPSQASEQTVVLENEKVRILLST